MNMYNGMESRKAHALLLALIMVGAYIGDKVGRKLGWY
jgi:hypothetical protein